jgi:hypothetical protein
MNPPFGNPSEGAKDYVDDGYPNTKNDVLEAFVERAEELLDHDGFMGAITKRTSLFLSTSGDWRERIVLRKYHPLLLADLGYGVLDAKVETAAYVFRSLSDKGQKALTYDLIPDLESVETSNAGKFSIPKYRRARGFDKNNRHFAETELQRLENAGLIREDSGRYTQFRHEYEAIQKAKLDEIIEFPESKIKFYRLISEDDKEQKLRKVTGQPSPWNFDVLPDYFDHFPSRKLVYWVSENIRNVFRHHPSVDEYGHEVKRGLCTGNGWRLTKAWWEVPSQNAAEPSSHPADWNGPYTLVSPDWVPYAKGAKGSPYFSDGLILVKWGEDGKEIKSGSSQNSLPGARPQNTEYYYRQGVSWPRLPYERGYFTTVARGSLPADSSPMLFPVPEESEAAPAIFNSDAFVGLIHLLSERGGVHTEQTLKYQVGTIKSVPYPDVKNRNKELSQLARKASSTVRFESTSDIRSHFFQVPALVRMEEGSLNYRINKWKKTVSDQRKKIVDIQDEINKIVFELYGIDQKDRVGIYMSLYGDDEALRVSKDENKVSAFQGKINLDAEDVAKPEDLVHDLVSYLVGVISGRFDIRYATGENERPELPDPTEPLPVYSPGMLTGDNGLPLDSPPTDYPIDVAGDGILVEEDRNPNALVQRIRDGLEQIFGPDQAVRIEQDAVEVLGEDRLEDYLRRPTAFFEAHRKQFTEPKHTSTSHRAPLYWPLQTPSQEYTLWIYYPDLDAQTLYTCVNDYITPKLENEVCPELKRLREKVQSGETAVRDELSRLETLEQELEEMREELLRVAELPYEPNQNDGVELTAAPLHNLFQHTSWSDRLEDYWEELQAGEYDWAYIAYSIWPDRVEDACREDKSIAIAHDREDLYEGD